MIKDLILKVIFILGFTVVNGQSDPKILVPEELNDNWEQWVEEVPISGNKRLGVQFVSQQKTINPLLVSVFIPERIDKKKICLRITSIDGRYKANLSYSINSSEKGMLQLQIPTQYEEKLKEYAPDELALFTNINSICNVATGNLLIASWEREKNNAFRINFNSRKKVTLIIKKRGEISKKISFIDLNLTKDRLVSFNKTCIIPMEKIDKNSEIIVRETWINNKGFPKKQDYVFKIKF